MKTGDERPSKNVESGKKSDYKPPRLVAYGSVVSLTKGVNGSNPDTGQSNNTKRGS